MNTSALTVLDFSGLCAHAAQWDDLWERSRVTQPTACATPIADWLSCFGRQDAFRAVVITAGNRYVAAPPLICKRKSGLLMTHDIPGNEWSPAGQLMFDAARDRDELAQHLVAALDTENRPIYWFGALPLASPDWLAVVDAARSMGWLTDARIHGRVPLVNVAAADQQTDHRGSSNFRRQLKRAERRLRDSGQLQFQCVRPTDPAAADRLLDACLQLEHAGWKGAAHTSVQSSGTTLRLLRSQARLLVKRQLAQFALLTLDDRLIAFDYGWLGKHVYHSFKIGYSADCARHSPGQLLTDMLIRHLEADPQIRCIDFLGPLTPSLARWRPNLYTKGRLALAPAHLVARTALFAAKRLLPPLRALGRRSNPA